MQAILTSFGFRSPIVAQKLRTVFAPQGKTVAVFPFAGFHWGHTFEREKAGLAAFGFAENDVIDCTERVTIARPDYIYVPGGDTFKLLQQVQQTGLAPVLCQWIAQGSVYIGVSAGAELLTVDLAYVRAAEDNNYSLTGYSGLGLITEIVVPHADQLSYSQIQMYRSLSQTDRPLLLIGNTQVAVVADNPEDGYGIELLTDCRE